MASVIQNNFRVRKNYAKITKIIDIPNLIDIQKQSYEKFLQKDIPQDQREDVGLQGVFKSVFPIKDFSETSSLEFVSYNLDKPKYDVDECRQRGMTFAAPIKVVIRLVVWDTNEETGSQSIRDVKEQEVYFGEIPLMTENGTFIINGTERVVVSQLHRSPGVFFESTPSKSYYLGKIIPYRGSWVEFEYETAKNILYVRIDRKRKFLATIFLRALGLNSDEDIIRSFYRTDRLTIEGKKIFWNVSDNIQGIKVSKDVVHPKTKEVLLHAGKKITSSVFHHIKQAKIERFEINPEDLEGAFAVGDIVDTNTGEVIVETNNELTQNSIRQIIDAGVPELPVFFPERDDIGVVLSLTLRKDTLKTTQEALIEIYRKLRPGDPPTLETATALFEGMFFDSRKYDFSKVGRLKFNIKLYENQDATPLDHRTLTPEDFYATIRYLLKLRKNIGIVDDIDHLGNRRVRAVGELMENQFRIGLVRMERAIKEKMSVYQELTTAMPHDLINAKPVMAAIREFFGSSQLSQFMDQTNPLSEITHKRRLSALGPGGLSRERAGFEVRDVHPTHYGRICPIETPEGPNIGLISSLSCFARINDYGFIESPYRRVKDGVVVDEVRILNPGDTEFKVNQVILRADAEKANRNLAAKKQLAEMEPHCDYLSAWEEDKYIIAQANVGLDEKGKITSELVNARAAGNFVLDHVSQIQYMDVSPKQLVSVAASLIPFLENDDANRALMGSNMQ